MAPFALSTRATYRRRRAVAALLPALLGALVLVSTPSSIARSVEVYRDSAVRSAFLHRFTGLVEWPAAALADEEFRFAVLAEPQVARELTSLLANRRIKGRPVRVSEVRSANEARDAHVLFVGASYTGDLGRLTAALAGRPVLVIADHPRGLEEGAVINFLLVEQRIRFEVSVPAAQRAGLTIGSQLLSVAARVRQGRQESPGQ